MNRFALRILFLCSIFPSILFADSEAKPHTEALFHAQMDAIVSNDYQKFQEHTDSEFQQAISTEQFEALANSLSSTFESGYEPEYLGALNQQGFKVHLWKVMPSSSESDLLVKMAMQENEIAGFWIE
ncbi:hypothetical protein ACT3TQ_14500 [Halomonas sp. AOP12-C2-37]|uniref:hypothetical protein n=1 Tax=unclassified Halomonas TaxID=2609666 RepID=UPI0040344B9D